MALFHCFSAQEVLDFNHSLLEWYHKCKRPMPWRDLGNITNKHQLGYRVLVSEVMLQQTQVATVIPYYDRWMQRWPDLKALSKANLDEVQETWKGLGYYSRSRRLLELAKLVCDRGGKLPESALELISLPGIGRYTAGAVASIAFGERAPAVDGNVQRVLCRLRGIGGIVGTAAVTKVIWDQAHSLVPVSEPGEWNQAVMELGAKICTPRNPSCNACPLQSNCHSFNKKLHDIEDCHLCLPPGFENPSPMDYPQKASKKSARIESEISCVLTVLEDEQSWYFMVKRDSSGLLADLWQFPSFTTVLKKKEQFERSAKVHLKKHCGYLPRVRSRHIGKVAHKFSHISMTYEIVHLELKQKLKLSLPPACCNSEWICEAELDSRPISTAMLKVFQQFLLKRKK